METIQAILDGIYAVLTQVHIKGMTDERREALLALTEALRQAIKAT